MDTVKDYLDRFEKLTKAHHGAAPWSFRFDQGKHDKHVLFGGITHGNEVGSLPALIELAEKLLIGDIVFGGTVSIVLGNVEACLEGERFIAADLNRVFLEDAPESAEKVRALEMMPLFDDVDLFIDFHQTIEPSEQPFFIFPYHASGYNWARILEPEIGLVTRDPERAFAQGQVDTEAGVLASLAAAPPLLPLRPRLMVLLLLDDCRQRSGKKSFKGSIERACMHTAFRRFL